MKLISKEEYRVLAKNSVKVHDLEERLKNERELHREDEKGWEEKLKTVTAERDLYKKLKIDADTVKTREIELDEDEKLLKAREAALKKREKSLDDREKTVDLEDTRKYKSGYEDGVADGLRKGYELTADDRQNMASIAALAAASHSDGATQKIAEQIVVGMEKTRAAKQLGTGSKKKS